MKLKRILLFIWLLAISIVVSIQARSGMVEDAPKITINGFVRNTNNFANGKRQSDQPADAPKIESNKTKRYTKTYRDLPNPIMWRPIDRDVTVGIIPYGFARLDVFYDSRQVLGRRENILLFVPAPIRLDVNGNDINAHHQFHMTAIHSRIGIEFIGPEWDGIKTSGIIETDFRGVEEETISLLRMRHAFGKIEWPSGSFLFGQFWHPLHPRDCFPSTVQVSLGAPIELISRMPQLRFTQKYSDFEFILAMIEQRDFRSNGPIGRSTVYIRNAFPNFHAQIRYFWSDHLLGIAGDYKRLVPRIVTDKNFKVEESIDSFIGEVYAAFNYLHYSIRMKTYFAQNAADHDLISGYAVRTVNPITDKRTYTNTAAIGAWLDASYLVCNDNVEFGIFIGGVKNIGASHNVFFIPRVCEPIIFTFFEEFSRIDYLIKIMPRYIWANDPVRFGFEIEFNRVAYGCVNKKAQVINACPVNMVRLLAMFEYLY